MKEPSYQNSGVSGREPRARDRLCSSRREVRKIREMGLIELLSPYGRSVSSFRVGGIKVSSSSIRREREKRDRLGLSVSKLLDQPTHKRLSDRPDLVETRGTRVISSIRSETVRSSEETQNWGSSEGISPATSKAVVIAARRFGHRTVRSRIKLRPVSAGVQIRSVR